MSYQNQSHRIQLYANSYGNLGRTHPAIDYFMKVSQANTSVTLSSNSFLAGGGKKRKVQLNYFPVQCDIEGTCDQSLCATGATIAPMERDFEITQCTATKKFSLRLEDLRSVDYTQWDYDYVARTILQTAMPAARKLLARDFTTRALSLVGVHTDGNATKQVKLLNPQTGAINPMGWIKVKKEYMDAGQDQPYSMGGGSEVFALSQLQGAAGINADGVNTGAVQVPNLWYDEGLIGTIKGGLNSGDYVLSIDPRMFKMVSFSKNAGIFRTGLDSIEDAGKLFTGAAGHDFILGNFIDPVTGIVWDLFLNFEKCGTNNKPEWSFHLEYSWDMFVMPETTCNVVGYNGITLWRTCPETEAACPTGGVSPVSPAAVKVWSATPVLASIPTISQSSIGGVNNTQESPVAIASVDALVAYMNANYPQAIFSKSGSNIVYTGAVDLVVKFNNGGYELNFS